MNFPLFVAGRYLLAKKSHNAVNVISIVSVIGVAVGTIALVIVMSVFNGLEDFAQTLFSTFDPDLKVVPVEGKSFVVDSVLLEKLEADPDIYAFSQTIEENVLVRYGQQQEIAVLKGVDDQYQQVTGIDTMIIEGAFKLWENDVPHAMPGYGLATKLHVGLYFITPMNIYAIRNVSQINMRPDQAVSQKYIFPSGIFAIDEEIDSKYVLVPLRFARDLFRNDSISGAVEIKLKPGVKTENVQKRVAEIFGNRFSVKNIYEQKEFFYRILTYEKWIAFMILVFVLLIASFNMVGSLSMLMIEKKNDIFILQCLGCDKSLIGRIFIGQGWMIVLAGACVGMVVGTLLCWIQIAFGIVPLPSGGTYVIESYPVVMKWKDFAFIFLAVVGISLLTIYFPVKYFVRKYVTGIN